MNLKHAVVTMVARDDLPDGGAGIIAETIRQIRLASPDTSIEVLISDLNGREADIRTVVEAQPEILNHNVETVPRLQRAGPTPRPLGSQRGGADDRACDRDARSASTRW